MIRIDKALVAMGLGSRKEIKQFIKEKRVSVNGECIQKPDCKIEENAQITVDGISVKYTQYVYFMLNKPAGVVSSTQSRDTNVLDLIEENIPGLFPCGRLDKDTTGLLLITNDGPLAHSLLSPKHHVEKEYEVQLKKEVSREDIEKIEKGVRDSQDEFMGAAYIPVTPASGRIILHEGKYHEIKRIFLALGNEVTGLKRIRMKNLILDDSLQPGAYRPLTEEELKELKN